MRFDVDIVKRVVAQGRAFDLAVRVPRRCGPPRPVRSFRRGQVVDTPGARGAVRPDRGRIVIDDETWLDRTRNVELPARARRVGYVFQDYALFPHRTVRDNVAAARARWYPRPLAPAERQEIDELLDPFALNDVRNSYPVQLSGGQRQRTALARAMAVAATIAAAR